MTHNSAAAGSPADFRRLIVALGVAMVGVRCPELSGQGSNRILTGKGTGSSAKR
jgi:hypothetical protein